MTAEILQPVTDSSLAGLEEATARYEAERWAIADVLAKRQISEGVASTFRLGFVAEPAPGHERYQGRLAIPYLGIDKDGVERVRSMRFRCLKDHGCNASGCAKYLGEAGERIQMFNVRAIKKAGDSIHVAEGELDAVVLAQCGLSAVGMPGASSWARRHGRMLAGFSKVYVWGDPDGPGQEFSGRVRAAIGARARVVHLREGDVNETFVKGGKAAIEQLIGATK